MYLATNVLVETIEDDGSTRTERVLHIDRPNNTLITMDVTREKALPVRTKFSDVRADLDAGRKRILKHDPWMARSRDEHRLTEAERVGRDRAWSIIESVVAAGPDKMFGRRARGRLIAQILERGLASRPTVYQLLYRYWRGGQSLHALIPKYKNSGGPGEARTASAGAGKKRGRPSLVQSYTGEATGINVDERVRRLLIRIGEEFYENEKGYTKKRAYEEGIKKYFHEGYDLAPDGTRVPVLPPPERLPTFNQFVYWYAKAQDTRQVVISREGQRTYDLKYRALRGDSTSMAFGPGSVYQVDATVGDVYLVSSRDPRLIIGRPVIYVVVDAFSRLVVGFTVGLEGPSWMGAVLAFENVVTDKVEFCASMGISISPEDWPAHHLPEAILADRGELEGANADSIVKGLGVRVANTPPYRPDWKPIVERQFRLVNDRIVRWLPGAVQRTERGARDYRLEAARTLAQLRKTLAICFLEHNQINLIEDYPLQLDMRRDGVRPYPLALWRWGLENRNGGLRSSGPEVVRRQLLPRAKATVKPRGLCYKRQYYTCALIEAEGWRDKARRATWRVDIAYDPWSSDQIWMQLEGHEDLIPCDEISQVGATGGVPWAELELEHALNELNRRREEGARRQARVRFDAQIEQVSQEAKAHMATTSTVASRAQRVRNITANRREEKLVERLVERQSNRRNVGGETSDSSRQYPAEAASRDEGVPMFDSSVSSKLNTLLDDPQEE